MLAFVISELRDIVSLLVEIRDLLKRGADNG